MDAKNIKTDVLEKVNDIIETDEDTRDEDSYEGGSLYPYDMPKEVDVREDYLTVFEFLRKHEKGMLITDPEFQRNLVWKQEQMSNFIESVILNLPLPPFYVNQTKDGKYIIIDGLQRTSTLIRFVKENNFKLGKLQALPKLSNLGFRDLSPEMQARIEDKKILLYVIKPSVPLAMVYDIFNRINTGGTQLTRQEIRQCLYLGKATRLLKELSEKEYFQKAINNGISRRRMKDREAILRFLAFRIFDYKKDYKNDMDDFLGEAMKTINNLDDTAIKKLKRDFERVMKKTYDFFGWENFRLPTDYTRGRTNIALLESICFFFANHDDAFLTRNKESIRKNYKELIKNWEFEDAIRYSTNDKRKVIKRFDLVQEKLGTV